MIIMAFGAEIPNNLVSGPSGYFWALEGAQKAVYT